MTHAIQSAAERDFLAYRQTPVFQSLDGLRCLSILAVVWHHSQSTPASWRVLNLGFLGVDLFFVISGFLIVTLLLRERSRNGTISLEKFYIRRTLRIFPLYYGLILAMAAVYTTVGSNSTYGQQFLRDVPYYLTYTANFVTVGFAIVWSLATEEQFYLVWPSIEKYLSKYTIPLLLVAIGLNQVVNLPAGKIFISAAVGTNDWTRLLISQTTFTPILLGVCMAHALHDARAYRIAGWLVRGAWAPAIYLTVLVVVMMTLPPDISGFPRLGVQICMSLLLMSCVYRENHVLRALLTLPPVKRIGEVSYGIYLLHIEVIAVVVHAVGGRLEGRPLLTFTVEIAATLVLAELSFRLYESPILNFKRRFSVGPHPALPPRYAL